MRIKFAWVGWGLSQEHDWDTPPWMVWRSTNTEVLHVVQVDPRKFWHDPSVLIRKYQISPIASGLVRSL